METPQEIRDIADRRLKEAEVLLQESLYDGAFYLSGYAVELYFKAKVCELLQVPDFYAKHVPNSALSKIYLTHNLDSLLLLSGLQTIYEVEKIQNADLMRSWMYIQEQNWSEKIRYSRPDSCDEVKATKFITSVKILTQWILQH
jgi:HEPN domain